MGAIGRGNVLAPQFHPEKSGAAGLKVLTAFLEVRTCSSTAKVHGHINQGLTRRVIICLDVPTNDQGDLVIAKSDQYGVRDKDNETCSDQTSEKISVPPTIGGGIRETLDANNIKVSALNLIKLYFDSCADKVSVGSDAVTVAEAYFHNNHKVSGAPAIEIISAVLRIR